MINYEMVAQNPHPNEAKNDYLEEEPLIIVSDSHGREIPEGDTVAANSESGDDLDNNPLFLLVSFFL